MNPERKETDGWTEAENYPTPVDADIARARLEAAGIEAVVFDGELAASWVYTNALGGVRLMVRPGDLARARDLLATEEPPDDAAEELLEASGEIPPDADATGFCPACHARDVEPRDEAPRGRIARWLNPGAPLRCRACGHRWRA